MLRNPGRCRKECSSIGKPFPPSSYRIQRKTGKSSA
ncbi:hypothetical protein B23_2205 [Geobacillus thermoleovorans B23]|nr:hypothetical protein B23_2205 [Geobacillus thermoleovorans B23]